MLSYWLNAEAEQQFVIGFADCGRRRFLRRPLVLWIRVNPDQFAGRRIYDSSILKKKKKKNKNRNRKYNQSYSHEEKKEVITESQVMRMKWRSNKVVRSRLPCPRYKVRSRPGHTRTVFFVPFPDRLTALSRKLIGKLNFIIFRFVDQLLKVRE